MAADPEPESNGEAETVLAVPWERAYDYRLIQPSGVTVTHTTFATGPTTLLNFTSDTMAIAGERIPVRRLPDGGQTQIRKGEFVQEPVKVLEVTVKLPQDQLATIVALLLRAFPNFTDEHKDEVRRAVREYQVMEE